MIFFGDFEEFDAMFRTPEILEVPAEAASPCMARELISTAKMPTQKVAVSQVGGRRPLALSEKVLSLTDRERKTEGRNRVHDHVADRGVHSWHHHNLAHTPLPISIVMKAWHMMGQF